MKSIIFTIISILFLPHEIRSADCTENDISQFSVSSCTCRDSFHDCPTTCPLPGGCGPTPTPKLNTCDVGCTDANIDCNACNLYFGGLCRCIRDRDCFHDGSTDPWTLLHDKTLITTSHRIPGILELGADNRGWQLGQLALKQGEGSTFDHGTLALNSVTSRTEDQVHIHVCDRPSSLLRDYLDKQMPGDFQSLKATDFEGAGFSKQEVRCQAAKTAQFNMAQLVTNYLMSLSPCDNFHVGAGLVNDKSGNTWGCITPHGSAEYLFCMN
ncbi:hypothetical protein FE257_003689 [Aspergillus nanangensis]|uniref:Uncharacterized protein n=1 Tax=Aspergillus nanangensis TaxID=2582783 RepID=A0AAD4CTY2_ASPNN|nr:hypothetical protein FE257_003689 [Aspergillus nanangensis]